MSKPKYGSAIANSLPFYGAIPESNRNFLKFPNARYNITDQLYVSSKNIINPRHSLKFDLPSYKNEFGNKIWYPLLNMDLNYNPSTGGWQSANSPMGPYFALGLGNYPRSMFKEVNFGKQKNYSKKNKDKINNKKQKDSITYCLPSQKKFPVNTEKRCSAALTYAGYAPVPCDIVKCVKKNCKEWPNVGKYSQWMKECEKKKIKNYKK